MPVTFGASGNRTVIDIAVGNGGNRSVTEGWVGTGAGNKKFFQAFSGLDVTYDAYDPGDGHRLIPAGARSVRIHFYGGGGRGGQAYDEDGVWFPGPGAPGGAYGYLDINLSAADEGYDLPYILGDPTGNSRTRVTAVIPAGSFDAYAGNDSDCLGLSGTIAGTAGQIPIKTENGGGGEGGPAANGGPGTGGWGADGYPSEQGRYGEMGKIRYFFSP